MERELIGPPDLEREPWTVRVAVWSARHRWPVGSCFLRWIPRITIEGEPEALLGAVAAEPEAGAAGAQ